jgi:sugar phosphate isomerase/epimerase
MLSRRNFALGLAASSLLAAGRRPVHLGAQTNAYKIADFDGLIGVLSKLRKYCFEGFETGYRNVQSQFDRPEPARDAIKATGLRFFGVHIWMQTYDPETQIAPPELYRKVALGASRLGAEHLILSGAPAASIDKKIVALNAAGKYAANLDLLVAYHNEFPEFANGNREVTTLMRGTDPKLVNFVIDMGHAFHAGADVVGFFREHHERIIAMHVRDFRGDEQVPLGQGAFPLLQLAAAIKETGYSGWLLNEEERVGSRPGDAAMAPARDKLFQIFGGDL